MKMNVSYSLAVLVIILTFIEAQNPGSLSIQASFGDLRWVCDIQIIFVIFVVHSVFPVCG